MRLILKLARNLAAPPELLCKQREKHRIDNSFLLSFVTRIQVSMIVREISEWAWIEFKRGIKKLVLDLNISLSCKISPFLLLLLLFQTFISSNSRDKEEKKLNA